MAARQHPDLRLVGDYRKLGDISHRITRKTGSHLPSSDRQLLLEEWQRNSDCPQVMHVVYRDAIARDGHRRSWP